MPEVLLSLNSTHEIAKARINNKIKRKIKKKVVVYRNTRLAYR